MPNHFPKGVVAMPRGSIATVLVLYCSSAGEQMRPAILHHLHVLANCKTRHRVYYVNVAQEIPAFVRHLPFDVVVLHTTLLCYRWSSTFDTIFARLQWLRDSVSLKIAIPQDEYDHAEILDQWLEYLRVSIVFTNFDATCRAILYPRMHKTASFHQCLTGYIDLPTADACRHQLIPVKHRPLDIVYRAAHLPYWFGSQGQLKHRIATIISDRARAFGFQTDISTNHAKTITSNQWFTFLGSSKTVIGCESGSSVLDPRGEIQRRIKQLLQQNPDLSFDDLDALMPRGWDSYRFFAIGPRHLEAIMTKTCQILVEGSYDGILVPERHYLSLKRDFSNLDEVLVKIKDSALLEATANRAYEDILLSGAYSYRAYAKKIESTFPHRTSLLSPLYWGILCAMNFYRTHIAPRSGRLLGYTVDYPRRCARLLKKVISSAVLSICSSTR
jgi:hypothetical protein